MATDAAIMGKVILPVIEEVKTKTKLKVKLIVSRVGSG